MMDIQGRRAGPMGPPGQGRRRAVVLAAAFGCVVAGPAWPACPPGPNQGNCQAQERQERQEPPHPPPRAPEPPRPPPVQQFHPQVQEQQRRELPPQGAPAQVYRPAPQPGVPPWVPGVVPVPGGIIPGVPPPGRAVEREPGRGLERDPRAGAYSYQGRTYAPFRAPRYRWPGGMYYQRYAIGSFLPLAFILPAYVVFDWMNYGLAQPAPGYEWVRYGPDLLLVNPYNGQVVDVVYSAFVDSGDAQ